MSEKRQDVKLRTKTFALRVIKLCAALPKTTLARVLGRQVLKSGTSVGAHDREACRARSTAVFSNKLEGALQELEETAYGLERLADSGVLAAGRLAALKSETDELTALFVTTVKSAKNTP